MKQFKNLEIDTTMEAEDLATQVRKTTGVTWSNFGRLGRAFEAIRLLRAAGMLTPSAWIGAEVVLERKLRKFLQGKTNGGIC